MASVTVAVNGQSVGQFLSKQKSVEIQKFLAEELRGFRHATQRHFVSHSTRSNGITNRLK